MKQTLNLKSFIRTAMLTALAAALTLFPQIATPTGGYVHFGDSVIYLAALFLGPIPGCIVGAVGHALADILSGHAIFALPTFIIKGCIGFSIGKIAYGHIDLRHLIPAGLAALLLVTFGYFLAEIPLYGIQAAATVFVSSPIQWLMSLAASAVLIPIFNKAYHKYNKLS